MRVTMFSSKSYDERYFHRENANGMGHVIIYQEAKLTEYSVPLADGSMAVCAFVNDRLDRKVLQQLKEGGVKFVAMRCAGFNNVDLQAAADFGIKVVRVPAYSPHAVAEHTIALLLTLSRRIHRAFNRVREGNFALHGLVGFDLHGLTVGVIGTGKIGRLVVRLFRGFGCEVLCRDVDPCEEVRAMGASYVELDELFTKSDVISLHCPLMDATYHIIDATAIDLMKDGVALINTSRGALVDTTAVISALKTGKIGNLAIDVYEEEENLFFEDQSEQVMQDDVFARLLTFPNVLITGHQAFLTSNALTQIARTTLQNLNDLERDGESENEIPIPEK